LYYKNLPQLGFRGLYLHLTFNSNMLYYIEMTFGDRLRDLRKERGLTQKELASKVRIDFTYLSKIENDRMPPPSEKTIVELARELGAHEDELLLLAKKVPRSMRNLIVERKDVPVILRRIIEDDLTEEELTQFIEDRKKREEKP